MILTKREGNTRRIKSGRVEIQKGPYTIRYWPEKGFDGGFTVYGPGIRDDGNDVPPKARLVLGWEEFGLRKRPIGGLRTQTAYYAIPFTGKRSVPEGRKLLEMEARDRTIKEDEIVQAIDEFWPKSFREAYLSGKKVEHPHFSAGAINLFAEQYYRLYHAAHRTFGKVKVHEKVGKNSRGFRKFLDGVCPRLYNRLVREERTPVEDIDPKEVGRTLNEMDSAGKPINKTSLRKSSHQENRQLYNAIVTLANHGHGVAKKKGGKIVSIDFTGTEAKLMGKRRDDIELSGYAKKQNSILSELLTSLVFVWGPRVGIRLEEFCNPWSWIYVLRSTPKTYTFTDADGKSKQGIADIRIGNTGIEIKNGLHVYSDLGVEDLLVRYTPGLNYWATGEIMDSSMVIFHNSNGDFESWIPKLSDAGISTANFTQFHELLKRTIDQMKIHYSHDIEGLRPRIANLDYILRLHRETALSPGFVTKKRNKQRMEWSQSVLEGLVKMGIEFKQKGELMEGEEDDEEF